MKTIHAPFLIVLLFGITCASFAQKTLKFTEQLTFSYQKDGQKKEFSVYLDRRSSIWLFTNADSFEGTADGLEFVVAYPNGKYLVGGIDDGDHKICQTFDMPLARKNTPKVSGKALGKTQVFGKNNYGWPTLKAQLFEINAGRMTQEVFLSTVAFDCRPLYAYNFLLGIEHYLPIFNQIDYSSYLPKNQLVVSDGTFKLESLSPTEYFIDLRPYRMLPPKK